MQKTSIVTSFLSFNDKILILKRSEKVKSMKGLWAGISGIIENNEIPLNRAKIEIFEEVGITDKHIKLLKSNNELTIESPQYKNHQWVIFPFLFQTDKSEIKLNWENSEFQWINIEQLKEFDTVPNLEKVLFSLL
jgi:8-oxo-dGTP pyrophosphatase MutT (NUDIX family)|tara:strand:+ start:1950 stop:2354 length:405 start_codon:yes stop_codon:yes gene_type:complete